ncbi:MAG: glycosyltransferase family 39 protein [Desulfuromonadales bacterium]|nr:glycosyltransferase family 39 protein [Desulfuromonadales bacterium]
MFPDVEKQMNSTRAIGILILICLLCLVPFLNKAFNIDDPTFIGMAKHIQSNPLDYFGYYMQFSPPVITNPPLVAYFIAIAGYFFGYSEISLHAAFLLPACAVIVGTYLLARDLCTNPFIAALAALCTPVFIVSSTTVMCDVLMLSFWVFSIYYWRRGIIEDKRVFLLIASALITFCILTKYSGICLVPLLLAYSLYEKRKPGEWLIYLLLPIASILLFDQITYIKYGLRQLSYIESFSIYNQNTSHKNTLANIVSGLSFLGGCILIQWLYFVVHTKKLLIFLYLAAIVSMLIIFIKFNLLNYYPITTPDGINWVFVAQLPFFVFAGVSFIFIVASDFSRNRDSDSLLLFLWVMGTFAFTIFVNWSVNARSILPIAPIAGIMAMRHLRQLNKLNVNVMRGLYAPIILSLFMALIVTSADYSLANSARTAAHTIHKTIINFPGKVWLEGHWGFQYYIESTGGVKSLNYDNPSLKKGDLVIIPGNNTNTKLLYKHLAILKNEFEFDVSKKISTMNVSTGAGFYSDLSGPLPFAVGYTPEKYYVYEMVIDKKTKFTY